MWAHFDFDDSKAEKKISVFEILHWIQFCFIYVLVVNNHVLNRDSMIKKVCGELEVDWNIYYLQCAFVISDL